VFCCQVTFDDRFKSKTFDTNDGPYGLQYTFTLQDAVTDCDEWMVPKSSFVELAEEYGLELVEWRNFHEFVHGEYFFCSLTVCPYELCVLQGS